MSDEPLHVFVLGLDPHNRAVLDDLDDRDRYAFHGVLDIDRLQRGDEIPVEELLAEAESQIRGAGVEPAAVIGWWDFPVSLMIPVLSDRLGLRSASLAAVLQCEHKLWSRLAQAEVVDCHPDFAVVDPADGSQPPPLPYPFWLKPVKSFSSALSYLVEDDDGFRRALGELAEGIGRVGEPFEHFLDMVDLPPAVADAGGTSCLAESVLSGRQCTVEGWVADGQVHVHGVVDSLCYDDSPSFLRFELPSSLPADLQEQMESATAAVITRSGLDGCTFNVEFFVDVEAGTIGLLEVNPRHSQSHAPLFEAVHGVLNHRLQLQLALGERPPEALGHGAHEVAAKWFLRCADDGVVTRVPSAAQIAQVEQRHPGTTVHLLVDEGDQLADLPDNDVYSYKLAEVYTAASDREALVQRYRSVVDDLDIQVDGRRPTPGAMPAGG